MVIKLYIHIINSQLMFIWRIPIQVATDVNGVDSSEE